MLIFMCLQDIFFAGQKLAKLIVLNNKTFWN